jgi:hypothetical protein
MEKFFDWSEVQYVPRLDNHDTHHLAWISSSRAPTPPDVVVEKLSKHLVKLAEAISEAINQDLMVLHELEHEPVYDWMSSIKMFLEKQPPLDDNAEVECITRKSKLCHLIGGILF